jgi:ATP-binding cassette subfamily F protein uup
MPVIDATQLFKSYGDRQILSDASLTIRSGERVGLVGNNGSGKSTLGQILAGLTTTDAGSLSRRRDAHIQYLAQEPTLPSDQCVADVVLSSLEAWSTAKQRFDTLTATLSEGGGEGGGDIEALVVEQARVGEEVERLGGWERMHEAETIIGHLGIDDSSRLISTLSGGERRRVALARILIGEPDLAILDEPTNHLDAMTIEWLEGHLENRFKGALLLITHDRYVLDRVTTRTLELEDGRIASYDGGYARYLEAKAERQAHAERVESNRQNFLRRELEWLRRQPKARGTKQKARIQRAEDAQGREAPRAEETADLRLGSERMGKTILQLSALRIERGGRLLIDGLDLALSQGERIGIVGANGSGKTSLLLCLQDALVPSGGELTLGANTKIGYLDQVRGDLDDAKTLRESVAEGQSTIQIGDESMQVGAYLERFLFERDAQRKRVGILSGGERARLCLARLLCQKTNLLLLDEPTNDLDIATLAALEEMLIGYGGSALIVSHDRWFLDRVATSILAFEEDGVVTLHRGNFSDYRERRLAALSATARERKGGGEEQAAGRSTNGAVSASEGGGIRDRAVRAKKLSYSEARELDGLFETIEAAEADAQRVEAKLSDPATYQEAGGTVSELNAELERTRERVEELTARWEELEARKEAQSS